MAQELLCMLSLHLDEKKAVQTAVEGEGRHLGERMVENTVEELIAGQESRHLPRF